MGDDDKVLNPSGAFDKHTTKPLSDDEVERESSVEERPTARKLTGTVLDFWGGHTAGPGFVPSFRGSTATYPLGVLYHAPWERVGDGFAEHSRRCARALSDAGVPIHLKGTGAIPWMTVGAGERDLNHELSDLLGASIANYAAQVHQCVPSEGVLEMLTMGDYWRAKGSLTREQQEDLNRRRVLSVVFEREKLTAPEIMCLKRVGQIWAACTWNAQSLLDSGLSNVHVIPVPHFPDDPLLALDGRPRKPGPVRFYNIGKWEPRKEQRNILGAFFCAFRPGKAQLILKTSPGSPSYDQYPSGPEKAVMTWLEDPRVKANGWTPETVGKNVFIIRSFLKEGKVRELHEAGDVYVNMSRAEGYDMPAYDAKLAGNLMVYVPTGALVDFFGEHDVLIPKSGVVECDPFYRWRGCHYLDYRFEDAVTALQTARRLVLNGKRCRGRDLTPWTAAVLGRKMRSLVEQLVENPTWQRGE